MVSLQTGYRLFEPYFYNHGYEMLWMRYAIAAMHAIEAMLNGIASPLMNS